MADRALAEVTSCEVDDFFSTMYNVTYTVTSNRDEPVDAEVVIGLVDADGVRIDSSFASSIDNINPGETARGEDESFYNNVDFSPQPVAGCEVVSVEVTPAS